MNGEWNIEIWFHKQLLIENDSTTEKQAWVKINSEEPQDIWCLMIEYPAQIYKYSK